LELGSQRDVGGDYLAGVRWLFAHAHYARLAGTARRLLCDSRLCRSDVHLLRSYLPVARIACLCLNRREKSPTRSRSPTRPQRPPWFVPGLASSAPGIRVPCHCRSLSLLYWPPLRLSRRTLRRRIPIARVLLGGMLLFLLATISWRDPERHTVLLVAGAGAVVICGVLLVVLTYTVQRPMVELQRKIARLGGGDLKVSVSFAHRNDEIGDLGRNFNQMVRQLRETREEIE